ncbi:uncharacterized protein LOC133925373 [Phragmites australis]|uniref:uncharacterized protein LOC133925373 n=1 Tax=Phragmites australis TaxID=29695 RepID=UPI002D769EDF|nr:uncharacterized protein LOC133925373 [Phragmites australis]
MALYTIYQSMPEQVMCSLTRKDTAKAAWEVIKTLKKEFEGLKMEEGETMDEFAGRVTSVITSICMLGDTTGGEIDVVRRFLRVASARYMQLIISIEQCMDLKSLTIDDLVRRYKAYNERVRISFSDPKENEHLLLTCTQWETLTKEKKSGGSGSGAKKDCDRGSGCGKADGGHSDGRDDDDNKTSVYSDFNEHKSKGKKGKCYNYRVCGHFAKECRKPRTEEALLMTADDESCLHVMKH